MIVEGAMTISKKNHALQPLIGALEKGCASGEAEGWPTPKEIERHISEETA